MLSLFLSAALLAPSVAAITPTTVGRMIDRFGPRETVNKLAHAGSKGSDFGEYDKVLDGVASGDARWLALVPKLEPGTDAGSAEALRIAVAEALPKNPADVLRLISREPSWLDACGYPMIEPTRREQRNYFRAAIPAVRAVRAPKLRRTRNLCLSELSKAERVP